MRTACRRDRRRYVGNPGDCLWRAGGEPERATFVHAIEQARRALVSTVSVVEARLVIHGRRGQRAVVLVDDVLRLPAFELIAPSVEEATAAYAAFVAFGKGSGHPANLNFGALFSYALAKVRRLPLLSKGNDFSHTDLASVLPRASPIAP